MRCEICGKYILAGKRIKVEGSTVVTCESCTSYGEVIGKEEPYKELKVAPVASHARQEKKPSKELDVIEEEVVVDDFPRLIKQEREKRGMKQEDLGKKINEPSSLIHRLESGKFTPSPKLIKKIGKVLGIKLLKKQEVNDFQPSSSGKDGELTLGDLVTVKKR